METTYKETNTEMVVPYPSSPTGPVPIVATLLLCKVKQVEMIFSECPQHSQARLSSVLWAAAVLTGCTAANLVTFFSTPSREQGLIKA